MSGRDTTWSDWIQDPQSGRSFSWRLDEDGKTLYHWAEETLDVTAPRSDPEDVVADYSSKDQEPIDDLSSGLTAVSIRLEDGEQTSASDTPYRNIEASAPNYTTSGSPPTTHSNTSGVSYTSYGPSSYSPSPGYPSSSGYTQQGQSRGMRNYGGSTNPQPATYSYYPSGSAAAGSSTGYRDIADPGPQSSSRDDVGEGEEEEDDDTAATPRNIKKSQGNHNPYLDKNFKVYKSKQFKPGYVFKILWSEPRGETSRSRFLGTVITEQDHYKEDGANVFTKTRRFVITAVGRGHNSCVPILTYQQQGVRKPGVKQDEHAIIYTGDAPSDGEDGLIRQPIEMITKYPWEKLDPKSRIHYAKTYTVEHNVRVFIIGKIAPGSERIFAGNLADVQGSMQGFNFN
ncbi:hypothetical protein BJ875DRAFT_461416 [Amylocarpus encephaloides]|uniref:DUF6590 domain-containing protein n=1 Tax=Amylocarpus encephaloides TaxID=45428 RepID=A0A9P7YIS4_9HELO|nr:hypothetical protein BJ875DRAFT_461416 [Amylocarpus encephaloides]